MKSDPTVSKPQKVNDSLPCRGKPPVAGMHVYFTSAQSWVALAALAETRVPKDE
jgi:hypothetical protein